MAEFTCRWCGPVQIPDHDATAAEASFARGWTREQMDAVNAHAVTNTHHVAMFMADQLEAAIFVPRGAWPDEKEDTDG